MKILVCISNVPDTTTKIKFSEGSTSIDTTGIQWVINPWDELSLTRALELKDNPSNGVKSVTVIHVGPVSSEPVIRKALAIGADDAVRVNSESADAYFVAAQIAEVIRKEQYDMVLCGIESSDYNGSLVGGMVAEFLGIPSVSAVSAIMIENGQPVITREIDGGKEVVTLPTPLVTMMARTKPIKLFDPVTVDPLTEIVALEKPAPRKACKLIDAENPEQLIELLQNEAKVI
jgi:electron transfer flavoprotein beta subunit